VEHVVEVIWFEPEGQTQAVSFISNPEMHVRQINGESHVAHVSGHF
jgi:hypothetical protein